jgi:hypothetical protein
VYSVVFRMKMSVRITKKRYIMFPFEKKIFWQFSLAAFGAIGEFSEPSCSLFTTI